MTDTAKPTNSPWLRIGAMVYTLMHAGWRKGQEQFKNRITITAQRDRDCPEEEAEDVAELIREALNVHTETGLTPRQLVEQRDELLKALRCAVNMDLPLIGSPTDDQLVSYWTHEKEQGRGCADDMLFIMSTLINAEARP